MLITNIESNLLISILVPLVCAFTVTALSTRGIIPILMKIRKTQVIHEDVPENHQLKSGTPTMGGISIIAGIVVGSAASMAVSGFSMNLIVVLVVVVIFGLVGYLDDYTKITKKRNLGLTAKQKLALQIVVSLAVALYFVYYAQMGTQILIPIVWKHVDVGIFIIPYIVFVIVAVVNAVNLTDGLDGLASSVSTMLSIFFPVIVMLAWPLSLASLGSLRLSEVRMDMSDAMFFCALAGACLGFLIYNHYPAKIFMGDTGSLAIGGGIATAAIFLHMELLIPICGFIFVAEALSVIIQVGSYKLRNKRRVFKMAPLHHHYELSGWHEKKVVTVFTTVTFGLCVAVLIIILLQY
ncbi:MAG: phospho-N-acetylmuramoyl-pentapeptide-transferase [Clostridiales Family XIII bacterium]|jgi:phospho-N-acetylmuramoyl-pentapeptide-transferase|nr:phospho-N-acetylmuramoyl-pentapeptide-transferase [Clostridiales Family XIII bacterium]